MQTQAGAWYLMRIRPYRTLDNVIEGAVITFVDITEIKRTRERCSKPARCCAWPWWCAMRTMPSPCRRSTATSLPGIRAPRTSTAGPRPRQWP